MRLLGAMFMGILDRLFTTRKKTQWAVLKLYLSVSKDRPSPIEREQLVDTLLKCFEDCSGQAPKQLDIHGPYGIAKGRTVGVKRFLNLLQTKGYEKFYALTMSDKNQDVWIHFMDTAHELDTMAWDFGYQEIVIGHKTPLFLCDLQHISAKIYNVFPFDYGYITELPNNFDLIDESKIKSSVSITDWPWRKNTNKILTGAIKDVYPTNLLNDGQADMVKQLGYEVTKFNDEIYVWNVDKDELSVIRQQLRNELIINTSA